MVMAVPNLRAVRDGEARVIITYGGESGDLVDPVNANTTHEEVLRMAQEALRTGGVHGLGAIPNADLTGFVVDPVEPSDQFPYRRLLVRSKVAFG